MPVCKHRYAGSAGHVHIGRALGEGLWESVGHMVHMNHMHVRAAPARVVAAAYAFVVLVWSSTYLANLVRCPWPSTARRLSDRVALLRCHIAATTQVCSRRAACCAALSAAASNKWARDTCMVQHL